MKYSVEEKYRSAYVTAGQHPPYPDPKYTQSTMAAAAAAGYGAYFDHAQLTKAYFDTARLYPSVSAASATAVGDPLYVQPPMLELGKPTYQDIEPLKNSQSNPTTSTQDVQPKIEPETSSSSSSSAGSPASSSLYYHRPPGIPPYPPVSSEYHRPLTVIF